MSTSAAKAARTKTTADSPAQRVARPAVPPQPDQRPATVAQRKLQEDIRNSPRAQRAATPAPVQQKANKTGLPDNLKSGVENLSGHSLDDVQVYYNSAKPQRLQAHAYAQGADIHVAPGQEQHLPHEAWHVAQQKQGRVKPTMQMKAGVAINDNAGLEQEAEAMGRKALDQPGAARQLRARTTAASAPAQLVKDPGKRSVLDTRINDLKAEAVTILSKMMVLGTDWEVKYGKKGKEKGSSVLGKKTDYKAELRRTVLKQYWKTLSTEERIEMAATGLSWVGKGLGLLVRGGKEALGLLPESGEKEKSEKKPEPPKQREEPAPTDGWLNSLTLEDVENIYEAYSHANRAFDEYAKAKAAVQEKAGEVGEAVGAEVGRWRNEADFNKRMDGLRQEFFTARKKYQLLEEAIVGNADRDRYTAELKALQAGLMNIVHGPAMVYRGGDLSDEARKDHPGVCVLAIEGIEASAHGDLSEVIGSGLATLGRMGGALLNRVRGRGGDDESQALGAAQSELATELAVVTNKSWSAYTKWRSTPTAVKAIRAALPKQGDDVAKLRAAVQLAKAARGEKSDNRSAETQIFYDAIASLRVTDLQSLRVTKSIIGEIGTKLG